MDKYKLEKVTDKIYRTRAGKLFRKFVSGIDARPIYLPFTNGIFYSMKQIELFDD